MNRRRAKLMSEGRDAIREAPRSVLVFRALQLGDMLCAVPALRALRHAWPAARVTLCGLPWARAFAERFPAYVDDFLAFPGFPGLPEQPCDHESWPTFLWEAQRLRADLVIQMHGAGTITNPLTALFGGRRHACLRGDGAFAPDPALAVPYRTEEPETWRLLRLAAHLGAAPQGEHLEFPVGAEDVAALCAFPGARALTPGRYVLVHPGARAAARRWPVADFAAVAAALAEDGWPVAISGSAAEAPLAEAIRAAVGRPCASLACDMGIGPLAALVAGARVVICNDTGVSHLAAALRVPSVVVLTRSEREAWPPRDRRRHRVLSRFGGVTVADVLAEARDALAEGREEMAEGAAPIPRGRAEPARLNVGGN